MTHAAFIDCRRSFLASLQVADAERDCFDATQRARLAGYVDTLQRCETYPLALADDVYLEGLRVQATTLAALTGKSEGAPALPTMQRAAVAATIDPVLESLGLDAISKPMDAATAIDFLEALDKRCGAFDDAQRERLAELKADGGADECDHAALAFLSGLRTQGVLLAMMQTGQQ